MMVIDSLSFVKSNRISSSRVFSRFHSTNVHKGSSSHFRYDISSRSPHGDSSTADDGIGRGSKLQQVSPGIEPGSLVTINGEQDFAELDHFILPTFWNAIAL